MISLSNLYLLALLCVPFYIGIEPVQNAQINVERFLILLLILFALSKNNISSILSSTTVFSKYARSTYILLMAFFLLRVLSGVFSPFSVSMFIVVNELTSNLFIFLLFLSIFMYKSSFSRSKIMEVFYISAFFVGLVVSIEVVLGFNPFTFLAPADAGVAVRDVAIERAGLLWAKATFEHPLTLAHYVALILPLFLFKGSGFAAGQKRWLAIVALIVIGISTGSRSLLMIMTLQITLWLLIQSPRLSFSGRFSSIRVLLVLVSPVLFVGAMMLAEQRSGNEIFSSYVREAQIRNGLTALEAKPWLGFGPGPGAITAIAEGTRTGGNALQLWERNLTTVDNWYLSVLLSSGILSFIAFVLMNLAVLFAGFSARFSRFGRWYLNETGQYYLLSALVVAFLSSNVIMLILSIFTLHPLHYIIMAWIVAILVRMRKFKSEMRHVGQESPKLNQRLNRQVPSRGL